MKRLIEFLIFNPRHKPVTTLLVCASVAFDLSLSVIWSVLR